MLRLIHNQTVVGPILVPDIDDGLPNKTARRMIGDPAKYERDGYANKPKQPCYISYSNAANTAQAGYIDLQETSRVTASNAAGAIFKLANAGLITVVSLAQATLVAPVLNTVATVASVMTLSGTNFTSTAPDVSSVVVGEQAVLTLGTGTAAVLFEANAVGSGGNSITVAYLTGGALSVSVTGNAISVTLNTGTTTAAQVAAAVNGNGPASALVTATAQSGGAGTALVVAATPLAGGGSTTLSSTAITGASGTFTSTSIVIPSSLIPDARTGWSAQVLANSQASSTVVSS